MEYDAFEVDLRVRIRCLGDPGSGVLSYGPAEVACADRTAGEFRSILSEAPNGRTPSWLEWLDRSAILRCLRS
jgi:hypothetical protein